ncbi:30S ribosomal protein S20 [Caldibacillus lycopersici]|uniref:Small ribosomal subunit protein bS20 n=1 Tax=Perspicuibacillus lycopersici TaxID=1325689 RepID=A0AAE3IV53_9BACI|nr:30S ribosomal protein S20 [Perspicuibacillus lycopersici]MCU9613939.1 30S ribosomal protein S20 [Perspicuibacillus lycopersici]
MANIKSAIKRIKTSELNNVRNTSAKSAMRTAIKKVEVAVANNDANAAKEALTFAVRKLDKAATKGLIHKNAAARHKSRLSKKVNALNA